MLVACDEARLPNAPPLGVSVSETASVPVVRRDAQALHIERVETCDIPPYFANDAAGPAVMTDLAYGDDDHQRYDLALPDVPMPRALVVLVHGGGWTAGSKSLFRPTIRSLATIGYAAATVEYRLARDDRRKFPAGLSDVRCAIRAARGRVGISKIIVIGASAGGHLAAMLEAPGFDADCSDRTPIHIDGAVLYYAPLELDRARERYIPKMRQAVDELLYGAKAFAEGGVDESSSDWMMRAREVTPSHGIGASTPPTLLLHGTADTIVPVDDGRDFAAALEREGVPFLLVEVPNQGHGFPVLGRKPELAAVSCTVVHFLEQIAAQ
jgi:acetyl esterase/lipase